MEACINYFVSPSEEPHPQEVMVLPMSVLIIYFIVGQNDTVLSMYIKNDKTR